MEFVALVTLLLLFQYLTFMMLCGMARGKGDVQAPATSGDEMFERALRVQYFKLVEAGSEFVGGEWGDPMGADVQFGVKLGVWSAVGEKETD